MFKRIKLWWLNRKLKGDQDLLKFLESYQPGQKDYTVSQQMIPMLKADIMTHEQNIKALR